MQKPRENFIGGIGGLRALAVLSVTLFHINPAWLPGGFVGVDIFFVISGFVVAHSVFGVEKDSFREYFFWFYRRRFLRILPAIFLYVLVTVTFGIFLLPTAEATTFIETTGISSLFGASNFSLLLKSGDYFAPSSEYNTFTHTWSLAVEEQYYFLFPLFSYFMIVRRGVAAGPSRLMLGAAYAACALSLIAAWYFTAHWREFAFYMLPTRLWELGIGYLLRYQGHLIRTPSSGKSVLVALLSAELLAALAISFVWTPADAFPFPGALLPCFATLGLIAIVWKCAGGWLDRLLQIRPLQFFGDLSYSLYLWHWGVVVMMRWTVGLDTLPLQLCAIILMLGLSLASYHLVERPLRYNRRLLALETPGFFGTYAAAGVLIAVASLGLLHEKPRIGLAASNDASVWNPYITPPGLTGACPVTKTQTPLSGGVVIAYQPRCEGLTSHQLFIVGDSHASAYQRMVERVASARRQSARLYWLGNCHLLAVDDADEPRICQAFRDTAVAQILRDIRPGDTVFLPGLYVPLYRKLWDANVPADLGLKPGAFDEESTAITSSISVLKQLRARGADVILEAPKPAVPTALFRCADWFNRMNGYCRPGWSIPKAQMEARRARPLAALHQIAAAVPGVAIWDPTPILCPGSRCEGFLQGKPLYYDGHHLSGFANDLLYPSFRAMLDRDRSARPPSAS